MFKRLMRHATINEDLIETINAELDQTFTTHDAAVAAKIAEFQTAFNEAVINANNAVDIANAAVGEANTALAAANAAVDSTAQSVTDAEAHKDAALAAKDAAEDAVANMNVGQPGGVATLGDNGKLIEGEIPVRLLHASLESRYNNVAWARNYGIVADGITDDSTAINAMLIDAAAKGIVASLESKSNILIDGTINIPSGTRFDLNGSTIKRGPTGSGVMFQLIDKRDIEIWGGTLNGQKELYPTATEWRHNINLDNSHNVTLRDLKTNRAKGDGVYIGGTVAHCTNIRMTNVICDANHRQGLSIIGVDDFVAESCRFINTAGTAPQAGVDVEPNRGNQICTNIRFIACTMTDNAGSGYLEVLAQGRTAKQGGVTLIGCRIDNNQISGLRLTESEDFTMLGGSLTGNRKYGIQHDAGTLRKAKISNVNITRNGGHGVSLTATFGSFALTTCHIESNAQLETGDGVNITPPTPSGGTRIIGTYMGTAPQRNGITTNANAVQAALIGNHYGGNTGAARALGVALQLDLDPAGS